MDFIPSDRPTTAIYIRIKRQNDTFFLLCDEYETVESLKNRILLVLGKMGLQLPKQEEPFCIDDIRLWLRNRVSLNRCWFWNSCSTTVRHATTNKFSTTPRSSSLSESLELKTNTRICSRPHNKSITMTTPLARRKSPRKTTEPFGI